MFIIWTLVVTKENEGKGKITPPRPMGPGPEPWEVEGAADEASKMEEVD